MKIAMLSFACVMLAGATAYAYQDDFVGWSADGSWYVMTNSGTDEMPVPVLCLSKAGDKPKSWPSKVPVPEDDGECTPRWDEMFPDDMQNIDAQTMVANASKLVVVQKPAKKGPAGETFVLKRNVGSTVEIDVARKGKRIARAFFEIKGTALPDMVAAYWRKDGGVVAITAGWAPDPRAVGYGPPSYLVMVPLDGSTADAKSPREQAKQLNTEGMKLLTAKKLDDAQKKFEEATATDETYMLAYYNLACTASLRHDKDASLKALRVLDESGDKEAKQYLAKGKTDHDLDFIADDPEAAKLLARKPTKK